MNKIRFSYNRQHKYTLHSRHWALFCALVLTLLTGGCIRMEPTPRPAWSPPEEYITAKQAYARILPAAREWDAEFVVTDILVVWHRIPEYRARPDGTASSWTFQLDSPTKWTEFHHTSDGTVYNDCLELKPASRCDRDEPVSIDELRQNAIPMDEIIDSDQTAAIIQGLGLPATAQPRSIRGKEIATTSHMSELVWRFRFQMSDDIHKAVLIDMLTGEVIHNEFAKVTPLPVTKTGP